MQEKSLFNYFKECITSKYIKFEGRARRREYWGFILFSIIIMLSVLIVGSLIGDLLGGGFRFMGIVPAYLLSLAFFIPQLAVSARRLHDIGKGTAYLLLYLVPFGFLVLFVFYLMDSEPGENAYGSNPKEELI